MERREKEDGLPPMSGKKRLGRLKREGGDKGLHPISKKVWGHGYRGDKKKWITLKRGSDNLCNGEGEGRNKRGTLGRWF